MLTLYKNDKICQKVLQKILTALINNDKMIFAFKKTQTQAEVSELADEQD